jgi:hypothetical protein
VPQNAGTGTGFLGCNFADRIPAVRATPIGETLAIVRSQPTQAIQPPEAQVP